MRDDVKINVRLCNLVKKYPVLYDARPGRNRNVKNRIWGEIGNKLNENATDCKQRWRQIRGRYWDYLPVRDRHFSSPAGKGFVLTYYLASKLQFLDKFMSARFKGTQVAAKRAAILYNSEVIKESATLIEVEKGAEVLRSAIPDMKGLNRVQNSKFKMGVIKLMEKAMQQREARKILLKKLQD